MSDDLKAEINSLLDECWNAIRVAIENEDGLDGAVGMNVMGSCRDMQKRLKEPS